MDYRRLRRSVVVTLIGLGVALAYNVYLRSRSERLKFSADTLHEFSTHCDRLRLRMTRDEVIEIMGPPTKEYDVRPQGKATDALYRELLYTLPGAHQSPYVDLQIATRRAVEIFCTENNHTTLPMSAQEELLRTVDRPVSSPQ